MIAPASRARSGVTGDASTVPFGRWDVAFAILAFGSGALLLYLGRSLTFWLDDWRFIEFDGGPVDYLRPFSEHWSTFPLALHRATFSVVELRSYLPYLSELIALHVTAVTGAYLLMRPRIGPFATTLVAFPLLLLGVGSENLFWAFQSGFVGSVMFGVWALFLVERPGRWSAVAAALLLVGGLTSSGTGLFFVVAVFGRTMLETGMRRRGAFCVAPPVVAYLVWYGTVGHQPVGEFRPLAGPLDAAWFAVRGLGHSTEAIIGLDLVPSGVALGFAVFAALVVVTGVGLSRGSRFSLAGGCLLALVAMYAIVGVARAEWEADHTGLGRYTYVAAFFLVFVAADLFRGQHLLRQGGTRWAGAAAVAMVLLYASSVAANLEGIRGGQGQFEYTSDVTRAYVVLARTRGGETWVDQHARFNAMPSVPDIPRMADRFDYRIDVRDVTATPGERAYEDALLLLIGGGFRIEPSTGFGELSPLRLVETHHLVVKSVRGCTRVMGGGGDAGATFSVPGGSRVGVTSDSGLRGKVALGHRDAPRRSLGLVLEPGSAVDVVVPAVRGDTRRWLLELELPGRGRVNLCLRGRNRSDA